MTRDTRMTTPSLRAVALVVNTASRRGAEALAMADRALARAGFEDVRDFPVAAGADLGQALAAALATDPDLLVVGGGDGTVGAAAGLVAGSRTILGVLPVGTAN